MFLINSRPLGLSSSLEVLTPNCVNTFHSGVSGAETIEEFIDKADENVRLFTQKWMDLYWADLRSQKKWFKSDKIDIDSCVLVLDMKTALGFPVFGRVIDVERSQHDQVERYYKVEYLTRTGQRRNVRRPAQMLCMVLRPDEDVADPDQRGDDGQDEDGGGDDGGQDQAAGAGHDDGDAAPGGEGDNADPPVPQEEEDAVDNDLAAADNAEPEENEDRAAAEDEPSAEADNMLGTEESDDNVHVDMEEENEADPVAGNVAAPASYNPVKDVFEPEVDDKKKVKVQFDSQRKNITDLNQRKK